MIRLLLMVLLCLSSLSLSPARAEPVAAEKTIGRLLETLPPASQPLRLAVLDLVDLEGKSSKLGAHLAEELLPPLFASKRFVLLERSLIQQLIKEQGLSQSALADSEQALAIGRLSGAQSILTGRYSVLADKVELNLRLLATETGEILALARAEMPKTDDIRLLLGEKTTMASVQETTVDLLKGLLQSMNAYGPSTPTPTQQPAARPLFYEDFSSFAPGTPLPIYGPSLVVRRSLRYPMNVLTSEDPGATLLTRDIPFPQNFLLEVHAIDVLQHPSRLSVSPLYLALTDAAGKRLALVKEQHSYRFYSHGEARPVAWRPQDWNIIALVRQGDVFRSYLNGQLIEEIRLPGYGSFGRMQLYAPQLRNWAFTRLALYPL